MSAAVPINDHDQTSAAGRTHEFMNSLLGFCQVFGPSERWSPHHREPLTRFAMSPDRHREVEISLVAEGPKATIALRTLGDNHAVIWESSDLDPHIAARTWAARQGDIRITDADMTKAIAQWLEATPELV